MVLEALVFAGLGLEMLLAFLIEALIYGYGLDAFSQTEIITHWSLTIVMWLIVSVLLLSYAKRKLNFCLFENKNNVPLLNWILIALILVNLESYNAILIDLVKMSKNQRKSWFFLYLQPLIVKIINLVGLMQLLN